ncbi:DivIVA domain-containing protein [Luteimicrobium subarcticum]|uniref:Cell wall synthesis protein Wag31 n=1 Tax=Luteimicrobium subarcticum TaxID=620910 RepID=A0A2M8WTR6_9MICO|nr:DivIVA domain-containing protein [Luteimicrobium subarcticum]PJI94330.1 DivIVA domain-containing protein [Luteimicrobium subarcticum]
MAMLTAEDILSKTFSTVKFKEGYDIEEVDDFLDEVVRTLNSVQEENEANKGKLAAAERRIAELSRAEAQQSTYVPERTEAPAPAPAVSAEPAVEGAEPASATGMLQLAQKVHDDYVNAGKNEGERLLAEAQEESARIVGEAEETSRRTLSQLEQERSLLERKIDELRIFERDYRTRLKSYLQNLLGDIDARGSALPARGASGADLSAGI